MLSRPVRGLAPVLAALAALLGGLVLAVPASAADRIVTITAEGVTPKVLTIAAGDTVTFVNEGTRLDLVARSTSDNWEFSSELPILPGRSYTVPADQVNGPGTYTYAVGDDDEEPLAGSVVVPAPAPSPRPTGSPAPSGSGPGPSGDGGGPPSGPPAQGPGGGTGTAQPPVPGGFGSVPGATPPLPGDLAPAPSIALPEAPAEAPGGGPTADAAEEPEVADAGPLAVPGRLGAPAGYRGYGLPAALAAVLAAGVVSLLVRLLLAEPAARRRDRGAIGGGIPVATVD